MKNIPLIFLILCLALLAGGACKKDSDNPSGSSAEFYFTGTLDGKDVKIEFTASNDIELTSSNGGSLNAPDCVLDYGVYIGPFDPNATPQFYIGFINAYDGPCDGEGAAFASLYNGGSLLHFSAAGVPLARSPEVRLYDAAGTFSSANGSQPDDSVVALENPENVTNPLGGQSKILKGTVHCKVYNDAGQAKVLDGSFRLPIEPYF